MMHLTSCRTVRRAVFVAPPLLVLSVCFAASLTFAAVVCDQVALKATHQDGVPFHSALGGSPTFQRVPDGTIGTVIGIAKEGSWLPLRLADTRTGWMAARYLAHHVVELRHGTKIVMHRRARDIPALEVAVKAAMSHGKKGRGNSVESMTVADTNGWDEMRRERPHGLYGGDAGKLIGF